jgi:transposase
MADWLRSCGVKTVAMQSTGVYWIPVYDVLEEFGFEVFLVNARHTKNLPGRKSDVQESQWLLKLHTYGLLNNSFQPPSDIRVLRTYWRQRAEHAVGMATCIQRMQKALTQMNIQVANVISDLSGRTGQAIVRAILGGERDPKKLAELIDCRIRATKEEVAKVWRATGDQSCYLCCNSKWKCTTYTSVASPNAIRNYSNTYQLLQIAHFP